MNLLETYLAVYGVLALSHILIQMVLAHSEHNKQKHPKFIEQHKDHSPTVTVIIPVYNEVPKIARDCLNSIEKQKYQGRLDTIVIDDGSKNRAQLMPIYEEFDRKPNFKVTWLILSLWWYLA